MIVDSHQQKQRPEDNEKSQSIILCKTSNYSEEVFKQK